MNVFVFHWTGVKLTGNRSSSWIPLNSPACLIIWLPWQPAPRFQITSRRSHRPPPPESYRSSRCLEPRRKKGFVEEMQPLNGTYKFGTWTPPYTARGNQYLSDAFMHDQSVVSLFFFFFYSSKIIWAEHVNLLKEQRTGNTWRRCRRDCDASEVKQMSEQLARETGRCLKKWRVWKEDEWSGTSFFNITREKATDKIIMVDTSFFTHISFLRAFHLKPLVPQPPILCLPSSSSAVIPALRWSKLQQRGEIGWHRRRSTGRTCEEPCVMFLSSWRCPQLFP